MHEYEGTGSPGVVNPATSWAVGVPTGGWVLFFGSESQLSPLLNAYDIHLYII